jgi:exopolyphosphatase / guanosine-5'-triphosphate,3'-diphosphate pyrophosphatase
LLERIRFAVLRGGHHAHVPIGVVDVGSNTVRLLVAERGRTLLSERVMLHLGADIEADGRIPPVKLDEVARVVRQFVRDGEAAGAATIEVLIASPGRQAQNGAELQRVLADASGRPTRILTAQEEGHLAFVGALSVADVPSRRTVAVVDVGGGSAQVVVGSGHDGPKWARSIDIGSQRLTSRMLSGDPPGAAAIGAARAEVEHYLDDFGPPAPRTTLAVGGSARALKRIVGSRIGVDELDRVLELLAVTPAATLVERYGMGEERARTLAAGAVIISGLQHRLRTPLKVVRAGLRDGALLALAAEQEAAAA